jgi:tRNA 2-selenouridine synthase
MHNKFIVGGRGYYRGLASLARHAPVARASCVWDALRACDGACFDVRSPGEFAADHVPGAVSVPVLSDRERARVGALHNGRTFEARRVGAGLIAKNIARALDSEALRGRPPEFQPLVYCWRGGQRSGALAHVMSQVGWRVQVLDGGYQSFRRQVRRVLEDVPPRLAWLVMGGKTGAGKTELLLRMRDEEGHQVLDLEGHAKHRGSLLGHTDGRRALAQPSQKAFETGIAMALRGLDPARPVWVESESSKIGNLHIPSALWAEIVKAPRAVLRVPVEARVQHTLDTYRYWTEDRNVDELRGILHRMPHGKRWSGDMMGLAEQGRWDEFVHRLLDEHYDALYSKQLSRHAGKVKMEIAMEDAGEGSFREALLPAVLDMERDARAS